MAYVSHGMNPDEVEGLGRDLQNKASQLETMINEIAAKVRDTTWNGPDAEKFKNQWWPDHQRRLKEIAGKVHGFGQSALNNAKEQREVSS